LLAALGGSAELSAARLAIEQQDASFALEKTQRIPDLDVSLGSQYSAEDRERVNLVGLSLPLPLFNRNQGNILAAARRADQSRDQRNATELRLRNEVATSAEQWLMAREEIDAFESMILPSAQRAVESTARGFEMGKFAFLDVLDAQRTLIQSRAQYIQALSAATESWVQLERILGDVTAVE
jgi:cobalt-zinc-cadmium efflux system outer membrane protein